MNPEQARLRAVALLADEFDRSHTDPAADADRFMTTLMRSGWRHVPQVIDTAAPRRAATPEVATAALNGARVVVETKKRERIEREAVRGEMAGGEG